jgi:hypothetical protein
MSKDNGKTPSLRVKNDPASCLSRKGVSGSEGCSKSRLKKQIWDTFFLLIFHLFFGMEFNMNEFKSNYGLMLGIFSSVVDLAGDDPAMER